MKKALSLMLTICMVLSLCATFVVSASAEDAVNLAAGKTYTYPTDGLYTHWDSKWECSKNVATAITDGVKDAGYYGEGATSGWGGGSPNPLEVVIDLEAVYSLESFTYTVCGGVDGISEPESVSILVSEDGENFTAVEVTTTAGEKVSPLDWTDCYDRESVAVAASAVNGRYVKFSFTKTGNFVFINELEVFGTEVPATDKVVTWEDGQVKGEDGNWTFDNAYGYTFELDADGHINGEDNIVVTTAEAYAGCNPNWAITVHLKPAGDLYEVVKVIVSPGAGATLDLADGEIALIAHSSASNGDGENAKYTNWTDKVAAMALKAGDKVKVSETEVYVLIPGVDDKVDETLYVKGENLVAGKEYVISEQFKQGGQDVNWGYDENAPIAYPDEGGTLTDGVVDPGDNSFANAVWAGFSANAPTYKDYGYNFVNIDLGEAKDISEMAIYLGTSALTSGIGVSNSTVQFFASDDGEIWEAVSYVIVPVDDASVNYIKVSANVNTNARYVQVRFARAGWLFVSEVEVYEAVLAPEGSVKETIAVDGAVTDNGWAADKWTTVSGDNGSWQYPTKKQVAEGAAVPDFTYDFQFRADDDKLYGAVVLDGVHVNEKNIKVRVWFRNDNAATVYSSFYDFVLAPDGTLETAAKYNQSTTENKGAVIEGTTLNAVAKVVDGKTVFEFSVDIAEVAADGNFDYFVSLEREQGANNGTLYFPYIPEQSEDVPHGNYPWLLWMAENDASVNVEDIALGVIVAEDTDDNLGDAGIYAIASLALVALIGTAVVIKKRA